MIVESPCPNLLIPDVNYAEYVLRTLKKFGNETALVSITNFDPVFSLPSQTKFLRAMRMKFYLI